MNGKSVLILIFVSIPLFLWGFYTFLIATTEFLAGPYFRDMGTYFWGLYLLIALSAMIVIYVIATAKSFVSNSSNRVLSIGAISLWTTGIIGLIVFAAHYTSPAIPPQGGPLPENLFILISWVILLTFNLVIALVLLLYKSKSKLRRGLKLPIS